MVEITRPSGVRGSASRALAWTLALVMSFAVVPVWAASAAEAQDYTMCAPAGEQTGQTAREINIVVDDSGSMFATDGRVNKQWSFAKYSLETFAALLDPADTLNVYLLSSFRTAAKAGPVAQITGAQSAEERVRIIHDTPFKGGGTPYAPVTQAYADLRDSTADEKWLVVLTDGKFQEAGNPALSPDEVLDDLRTAANADAKLQIAYLALGDSATTIGADPKRRIYTDKANTSLELLAKMDTFSNIIFKRDARSGLTESLPLDLPLQEMIVFAQGRGTQPVTVSVDGVELEPVQDSSVRVMWTKNPPVEFDSRTVSAEPNKNLEGVIARYRDVPAGLVTFGDLGASTKITAFYEPQVNFGYRLLDADGVVMTGNTVPQGSYSLDIGFMDADCQFTDSALLGEVTYRSAVSQGDKVIAEGDAATLGPFELLAGEALITPAATYLEKADVSLPSLITVALPPLVGGLEATPGEFKVSELAEFPSPSQGVLLEYVITEDGVERPPTSEEWAAIDDAEVTVTSEADLEFEVIKQEQPGEMILLPRAPGGDVFAASTGEFEVTVTAPAVSERASAPSVTVPLQVEDDRSWLDKFLHWMATWGWKILLLLLILAVIAGYVFKKRFPREIKAKPDIRGIPQSIGQPEQTAKGSFKRNGVRRWLPFLADTATIKYWPSGASGFTTLKVKARGGKQMSVVNWQQMTDKGKVDLGGRVMDESMRTAPLINPHTEITAQGEGMTYVMTLA